MDIQAEKNLLIKSLEETNDTSLLKAIHSLIDYANQRDEEYLGESIEQYNIELEKAEAEVREGKIVTHEEAIKRLARWQKEK